MKGKKEKRKGKKAPVSGKPAPVKPIQKPPTSTGEARGAKEVTSDTFLSRLTPEARAQLEAQEKVMEDVRKFVEENPEAASQLLRAWLMAAEKTGK
jgi:flagellar biosynthesis/type III secretory pathway M-ring protein FliF/YscJ